MKIFILVLGLLISIAGQCEKSKKIRKRPRTTEWSIQLDILAGGFQQKTSNSFLNPDNQVYYSPEQTSEIDLRPSLKWTYLAWKTTLFITPRIIGTQSSYRHSLTLNQEPPQWTSQ